MSLINAIRNSRALPALAVGGAVALLLGAAPVQISDDAPSSMRRLTQSQYRQTIADVFGPNLEIVGRFEPDLRVHGLIAVGTGKVGISPAGLEQYEAMARHIADQAMSPGRRSKLVPCEPKVEGFDRTCARAFLADIGEKLYRRPLGETELESLTRTAERAGKALGGFYPGVESALAGMLVSPHFLYRIERVRRDRSGDARLDPFSKATRLSYFLINSTPDEELLRAARAGELDTSAGLQAQVDRLVASPGLERGVRAFFWDMLQFESFATLSKDAAIYPAYSDKVAAAAEEQTLRTAVDHLIVQDKDYRDLFTTRETWVNRQLGLIYAVPVRSRTGWEKYVYPEDADRAGWLTDFSFLALHSHPGRSSPTLRGKAIREIFLCQPIPPPPPDVDFTVVQDATNAQMKTARERLTAHRTQPACSGCHKLMDPLGLSLERFDGAGIFRMLENGAQIDLTGSLDGVDYASANGLGQALRASKRVNTCLVGNMYRYALGRDTAPAEKDVLNALTSGFAADGYRVPALMRRIALTEGFYAPHPPAPEAEPKGRSAAARANPNPQWSGG